MVAVSSDSEKFIIAQIAATAFAQFGLDFDDWENLRGQRAWRDPPIYGGRCRSVALLCAVQNKIA